MDGQWRLRRYKGENEKIMAKCETRGETSDNGIIFVVNTHGFFMGLVCEILMIAKYSITYKYTQSYQLRN